MEPVTSEVIQRFLTRLGAAYPGAVKFYLLGGSALFLLGNPRGTMDIDYTYDLEEGEKQYFEALIQNIGKEMQVDLESVPLGEFIPLPPNAEERSRWIGRYGQVDVYVFDLYSIALSKIARGFETDLDDVLFMLNENLIEINELERLFELILPNAKRADIIPREFQAYFEDVKQRFTRRKG